MTVFFTDFTEYPTGSQPAKWLEYWSTSNTSSTVQSGGADKILSVVNATASGNHLLAWQIEPDGTSRVDIDVLCMLRTASVAASTSHCGIAVRANEDRDGYICHIYGENLRVDKYVNSAQTNISSATLSLDAATWYYLRFQVIGTAIKARISTSVPDGSTWDINTTDSSSMGAINRVGVFSSSIACDPDYEFFGYTTGGETPVTEAQKDNSRLLCLGTG